MFWGERYDSRARGRYSSRVYGKEAVSRSTESTVIDQRESRAASARPARFVTTHWFNARRRMRTALVAFGALLLFVFFSAHEHCRLDPDVRHKRSPI